MGHISLKLPLVLRTDSLVLDLIFHCTKTHWMSECHRAARSNRISHGKWEESSGVLSLWLSHQSFHIRVLPTDLRGHSGHFHLTGPASYSAICLTFLKILFLHLFYFPFPGPASLQSSPFPFSVLMLAVTIPGIKWPGSWLRNLGGAWRLSPHLLVQLQCSSPCSFHGSWSGLCFLCIFHMWERPQCPPSVPVPGWQLTFWPRPGG